MADRDIKNKSLDELVSEDKKLSKRHKVRDERDERRPPARNRSRSGDRRRGTTSI
jgi:hypothetical protein